MGFPTGIEDLMISHLVKEVVLTVMNTYVDLPDCRGV